MKVLFSQNLFQNNTQKTTFKASAPKIILQPTNKTVSLEALREIFLTKNITLDSVKIKLIEKFKKLYSDLDIKEETENRLKSAINNINGDNKNFLLSITHDNFQNFSIIEACAKFSDSKTLPIIKDYMALDFNVDNEDKDYAARIEYLNFLANNFETTELNEELFNFVCSLKSNVLPLTKHLTKFFDGDIVKTREQLNTYKPNLIHPVIQVERLNRLNKKDIDTNNFIQIIELMELAYIMDDFGYELNNILNKPENLEEKIKDLRSKVYEKYAKRLINIGKIPYQLKEDYSAFIQETSKYLKENGEKINPIMLKSFIYNIGMHNDDIVKYLCSKDCHLKDFRTKNLLNLNLKEDVDCAGYLRFFLDKQIYNEDSNFIISLTKAYIDPLRYCYDSEKREILEKIIDLRKKIESNPEKYVNNDSFSSIEVLFNYYTNELAKAIYVYDDKTIDELFSKRLNSVISFLESLTVIPRNLDLLKDLTSCQAPNGKNFTTTEKLNLARIVSVFEKNELRKLEDMCFDGVVDLESFKKDYFYRIFRTLSFTSGEIDSIDKKNFKQWDITYLPMIIQAKNGNIESFSEFFKAAFLGNFMDYIHDAKKNIGKCNLKTKEVFEKRGINYDKWLNAPKENDLRLNIVDNNQKKIENCINELLENIEILRNSPVKQFFDKRFAEYIKEDKFVLPLNVISSNENLENFIKNLLIQLEPAWKRAKKNMEKNNLDPSIYEQASKTLTLKEHFEEIQNTLSKLQGIEIDKTLDLTIKMWDRIPEKDLFQGNYSTCCIALDRVNGKVMPDYLLNTSFNMIEIVDNQTGRTIGNALCFLVDDNGKTCFVIDNIEINNAYKGSKEASLKIFEGVKSYVSNFCKSISKEEMPIYMGKFFNDVSLHGVRRTKTIDFLGDINATDIYLDIYGSWNKTTKLKKELEFIEI